MSMQSHIASSPRVPAAESDRTAMLIWSAGLFTLTVILAIGAIVSGLDPAYFAVSIDAGALL